MSSLPPKDPDAQSEPVVLPPVQPPTAGFILQLFLIPMIIVVIIVMVWLMFSWLAHMGSDPQDLVRNLRNVNDKSWQDAAALADLLRNPQHEHLKSDPELAKQLGDVLHAQIATGAMDDKSVRLRIFLARALGEFQVPEALPALVEAATVERDPAEMDVRRSALEAIAVLAQNLGPSDVRDHEQVMEAVLSAARERGTDAADDQQRAQLRERAAFALGVIGGPAARDQLATLLNDRSANARYNAATGLARYGDERAVPVLLEMLDPENRYAAEEEESESGQQWKRMQVIKNGIRASVQLAEQNPEAELQPLRDALSELVEADLEVFTGGARSGIQVNAQEALQEMERSGDEAVR